MELIEKLKSNGASDETVLFMLREAGWPERDARAELSDFYAAKYGEVPQKKGPAASNPLDAFLYLFSTGCLISWVSAVVGLADGIFTEQFGTPDQPVYNSASGMSYAIAAIIVTAPTYLVLMRILHARLKAGVTSFQSPPRVWVLSFTLLVGVGTLMGYVINAINDLITFEAQLDGWLSTSFTVLLVGGLTAYYVNWLQHGKKVQR